MDNSAENSAMLVFWVRRVGLVLVGLVVVCFFFLIILWLFLLGWVKLVLWIEKFSIFYSARCPGTDE